MRLHGQTKAKAEDSKRGNHAQNCLADQDYVDPHFHSRLISSLIWWPISMGFPGDSDGKESACNVRDPGLIPGSGRCPEEGNGNLLSILVWRIPQTEEPGWLQSTGSQQVRRDWATNTLAICICTARSSNSIHSTPYKQLPESSWETTASRTK